MNLSEDWGMLSAAFSGFMGVLYAILDGSLFMGVLALVVIGLVYEVIKLRDHIRENVS